MSKDEETALLRDYLSTCAKLASGFERVCTRAEAILPLTGQSIDAIPLVDEDIVLVFIKRFEQFEDALHRTLKAISKIMEYGKVERLTAVDVTRRARALGIIDSEQVWADAVRARNALAHEYPLNPAKRAAQLNGAWDKRETLTTTWIAIERFVEVEQLLS